MQVLNCVIVDDDELDRLTVTSFVKRTSNFNLVAVCSSVEEALEAIYKFDIDVLFLDIDMEGENGIELRQKAIEIPVCVFITDYPEYAVESFNLETLDFIVKPVNFNRFEETVKRINEFMEIREKASLYEASLGADVIFIKEGHKQIKMKLHEILYLEALKDYTLLVTNSNRHCVLSNLGNLLTADHFKSFIRVHRSYAVQKQRVTKIKSNEIVLDNHITIPVGRSFRDNLNQLQ